MLLNPLLDKAAGAIRLSEMFDSDGATLFATACELGLEGIVAKRLDAPYRSGRGGEWRKVKSIQSDTFVVVGYEPSTSSPGAVASLLLGARNGDSLVYVGSVGTGFTAKDARELTDRLDAIRTKRPAVSVKGKSVVFVEPILTVEIEYRAWTGDRKLCHASYKGLRDVEDTTDVYLVED